MRARTRVVSAAIALLFAAPARTTAQRADVQVSRLGLGWARSSVNAVDFRTASPSTGPACCTVAWAEHNRPLHYPRAVRPGSLVLGPPERMTGEREERVTYPQFYSLPGGELLFVYRDGQSGNGDVLLDRYDVHRRAWRVLQHPLIAGEGKRNAYLNQLAIDARGGWHLS